MINKPGS